MGHMGLSLMGLNTYSNTPFQQGSLEQTEAMGVICAVRHLSDFTALLACRLQMQITVVEADSVKNLFSVG
jgi:hypothetical protein